jgi:hypothetical protein
MTTLTKVDLEGHPERRELIEKERAKFLKQQPTKS